MDVESLRVELGNAKEQLAKAIERYMELQRQVEVLEHDCGDPECLTTRPDGIHSTGSWVVMAERTVIAGDLQASRMIFCVHGSLMSIVGMAVDLQAELTFRG